MDISIIRTHKNPLLRYYVKHISNMLPANSKFDIAMESRFSPSGSPPGKMYLLTNALVRQLMTHTTYSIVSSYCSHLFTIRVASQLWREISCILIIRQCFTEVVVPCFPYKSGNYQETPLLQYLSRLCSVSKHRPVQVTLWFQGPRRAQPMVWIIMMPSSCIVQIKWFIITFPVQPALFTSVYI